MPNLKEIKINNIVNDLPAEDAKVFLKNKEQVFELPAVLTRTEYNPLIDVEISLRRCERVGFFKE